MSGIWIAVGIVVALVLIVAVYDVVQKEHTILRNYPILGHFRYMLESIGPELRQYIVTDNNEERPFSRDQRRWVYASAKQQNNYFGFGTDNQLEKDPNILIIKPSAFPTPHPQKGEEGYDPMHPLECRKVLGGARDREKAFRPKSAVYISAMSYGSLSAAAVEALNRGCAIGDILHNTGEGGIASHHDHGGDLIWQLGTGYFGARDENGNFSMRKFAEKVEKHNVKAIEVKLSQGAKPGRGGVLPGEKVTEEIAEIRGIPAGEDCISPPGHSEFDDADELLDFVERLADVSGLPVGIKSAVGKLDFWHDLADQMANTDRGVDFINIDGGEGGTGAAPLVFSDNVALPFKTAFARVYPIFMDRDLTDDIVFMGAGRLGFPESALLAFSMGVDMIGVAREAMMAIGCIQAKRCHSGNCPSGVATQNRWLMRGLDPTDKSARLANYVVTLRQELLWLTYSVGKEHPSEVTLDDFEIIGNQFNGADAADIFGYLDARQSAPERQTENEDAATPITQGERVG